MNRHIETGDNQRRLSNILWGQARFIASREYDGKRVSLYLLKHEYYIIWYCNNEFERVEKIETVPFGRASEIFGKFF